MFLVSMGIISDAQDVEMYSKKQDTTIFCREVNISKLIMIDMTSRFAFKSSLQACVIRSHL